LVRNLEAVLADLQGVWGENKTYALAVHFRQNPGAALECRTRVERVAASFPQVKIFLGHAVVEVRSRECGKGAATRLLLSRPPFAGRIPMFVGDDGADEEAFLAVQAVGGHGIKVGCGETGAHYRLPDVAAVHRWIRDSLASA
jgi:trehalose 6-phosphate phosphatase